MRCLPILEGYLVRGVSEAHTLNNKITWGAAGEARMRREFGSEEAD